LESLQGRRNIIITKERGLKKSRRLDSFMTRWSREVEDLNRLMHEFLSELKAARNHVKSQRLSSSSQSAALAADIALKLGATGSLVK
jgi:hypothetical protein